MTSKLLDQTILYRGDDEWKGLTTEVHKALMQGYRPKPKKSAVVLPDMKVSAKKKEVK